MEPTQRLTGSLRLTSDLKDATELVSLVVAPLDRFTTRVARQPGDPLIKGRITIKANDTDETVEAVVQRFGDLLASLQLIADVDVDLWVTGEFSGTQIPLNVDCSAMNTLVAAKADLLLSLYANCDE